MNEAQGIAMILTAPIIIIPLIGIMTALTPYLMKKSECFAVTVPESAENDPFLKRLKKRYLVAVLLVTALMTALGLFMVATQQESFLVALLIGGVLFILLFGYGLMLRYRSKVHAYKKEQNWSTAHQESVAVIQGGKAPKAISLKWNLLYIPVIALALAVGIAGYASMPEQVPLQVGYNGEITSSVEKGPFVIAFPALVQAIFALSCIFSHWQITRSKQAANPSAPTTSSLAYGMFAHAQSVYLLVLGMMMCTLLILIPLSFIGAVTLTQAGFAVVVGVFIAVIGGIAISVVYGQGGARIFARMQALDAMPADEDRFWKLGIFYVNREDPSLFLLERFGIGWTVNFARPVVWLILAAFLVVTTVFMATILSLT